MGNITNAASMAKNRASRKKPFLKTLQSYLDRNRLGELLVMKGIINPSELREALKIQKQEHVPLGHVLIQNNQISKKQLRRILLRQHVTRYALAIVMCLAAFTIGGKTLYAMSIKDVPAKISVAEPRKDFQRVAAYPGLFGSSEKRSDNLKAFTKWSDMFKRFEASLKQGSDRELTQWRAELATFKGGTLRQMADKVNRLVNKETYIVDKRNWGKSDYWATPVEFLKNGGDCEDFAIAKYTALRALGVPEERLRLAIVHDNVKNIPHAILIVYTEQGPIFLDNQSKSLGDASQTERYRPIFSINRTAWWLHKAAPEGTRVASAR